MFSVLSVLSALGAALGPSSSFFFLNSWEGGFQFERCLNKLVNETRSVNMFLADASVNEASYYFYPICEQT